jgi:hypothetical protein
MASHLQGPARPTLANTKKTAVCRVCAGKTTTNIREKASHLQVSISRPLLIAGKYLTVAILQVKPTHYC